MMSLSLYKNRTLCTSLFLSMLQQHTRLAFLRLRLECVKMVGGEKGEEQLRAVSFAAGTAAFIACIQRAFVVSVFMHWRVWAFLALNLLLLAILFTSKSQTPSNEIRCESGADAEIKKIKKRRPRQAQLAPAAAAETETETVPPPEAETDGIEEKVQEDYDELSEEELKKRVEDFIAMFRQHLICDAKGVKIMGCTNAIATRVH